MERTTSAKKVKNQILMRIDMYASKCMDYLKNVKKAGICVVILYA